MKAAGGYVSLSVALLWLFVGGPLRADISDVSTRGTIDATAQVAIPPDDETPDPRPARDDDRPPDKFDVNSYIETAEADAMKSGLRAKGRSNVRAVMTSTPGNLSFTASGTTEATTTRTGRKPTDRSSGAGGSFSFSISFEVDSPSRFSLNGLVQVLTNGATGSSEAQVVLEGSENEGRDISFDFDAEDDPGDPRTISVSKSGVLQPGSYSIFVFSISTIGDTQPSSRTNLNISFNISSPPPELDDDQGAEIRWTQRSGGSFFDPDNWSPERVPTKTDERSDIAIFGLRTEFGVSLAAGAASASRLRLDGSATVERVVVNNRNVLDLSGGTLNVEGMSLVDPSLIVTEDAKLNLTGGTLNTNNTILGRNRRRSGEAHVFNEGTKWINNGRLTVGDEGDGKLFILGGEVDSLDVMVGMGPGAGEIIVGGESSNFFTGSILLGGNDVGILKAEAGGGIGSSDAILGTGAIGAGLATITGVSPAGEASSWFVNRLRVGSTSLGQIRVDDGGSLTGGELVLGLGAESIGVISVNGAHSLGKRSELHAGNATIGDASNGVIEITAGGRAELGGVATIIGRAATGRVRVDGVSSQLPFRSEMVIKTPLVGIGAGGTGELLIQNGGLVEISGPEVNLGLGAGGFGRISVEGQGNGEPSSLIVEGKLTLGSADGGEGELSLDEGDVEVTGDLVISHGSTVQGTGTLTFDRLFNDGVLSPGLSPGSLTLNGDFVQGPSGVIRAEIGGSQAGVEHDLLVINGSAELGGTLVLQFMDGFAPRAGEAFSVLNVDGVPPGEFAEVKVEGLKPGAQFETTTVAGTITTTALNNAEALPAVAVKSVGKKKKGAEKGRRPGVFLISRKGDKSAPLTVHYRIQGTATNGVDYLFLPGMITIPRKKAAVAVTVRPFDDLALEGPEDIALEIVPGEDYTHRSVSRAVVTLVDNEKMRLPR